MTDAHEYMTMILRSRAGALRILNDAHDALRALGEAGTRPHALADLWRLEGRLGEGELMRDVAERLRLLIGNVLDPEETDGEAAHQARQEPYADRQTPEETARWGTRAPPPECGCGLCEREREDLRRGEDEDADMHRGLAARRARLAAEASETQAPETTICFDCGEEYPSGWAQVNGAVVKRDGHDQWCCGVPPGCGASEASRDASYVSEKLARRTVMLPAEFYLDGKPPYEGAARYVGDGERYGIEYGDGYVDWLGPTLNAAFGDGAEEVEGAPAGDLGLGEALAEICDDYADGGLDTLHFIQAVERRVGDVLAGRETSYEAPGHPQGGGPSPEKPEPIESENPGAHSTEKLAPMPLCCAENMHYAGRSPCCEGVTGDEPFPEGFPPAQTIN